MKIICFLVGLFVTSCLTANCPVDVASQPKIVSDSVGLTAQNNNNNNSEQNLVYNYQFESPFPGTPNVAIGLNQIQSSPSNALDIRVSNPKTSENGVYFQAQSGADSQWKNIKINFLASNRPDMQIGTAGIKNPTVNPSDNTFNLIYNMKTDQLSSQLKIKTFLQGLDVFNTAVDNSSFIGIQHQSSLVANKQIFFTFASPQKFSLVRALQISVIVFNVHTPGLLYADGTIDQNYVVSTLELTIPRHGINELRTYIVGLNSFQTTAAQPISISSSLSETFSLNIGPIDRNEIQSVSVSYLILSVVDCGSCSGYPLLFDGICQPDCPVGFKPYQGRCIASKCPEGQTFNDKKQCVSICGLYEQYVSGTCVCTENFYKINGFCAQCPASHYYNYRNAKCSPLCGDNSDYNNGVCVCKPNYFVLNGICDQCVYGSVYDANQKQCVNICSVNEVYSPTGCVCANGYNKIGSQCAKCPFRRVYDPVSQSCGCQNGFELMSGYCVPVCRQNEVRVEGVCVCTAGFNSIGGLCNKCGTNSQYSDFLGDCICNQGYIKSLTECVLNCTNQQQIIDGKCVDRCNPRTQLYQYGQCVCQSDYERFNGICVSSCLAYEFRINGSCICIPGYFKGPYPICQPINCPEGTAFNQNKIDCISICQPGQIFINNVCVCKYGYNRLNNYGNCVMNCSANEVQNSAGFCDCKDGYIRVSNGICYPYGNSPGVCPPGLIRMFGECRSPSLCGEYEYWSGFQCVCSNGYYKVNGACVVVQPTLICPDYSMSNGVNCMCSPGYFPVQTGVCQPCPDNTFWNGDRCIGDSDCIDGWIWNNERGYCMPKLTCRDIEIYDGVACRCQQGLFKIAGADCAECPSGTVFDGAKCSAGTPTKYCADPYSFWNGFTCACISGYWPLTDGKCTSCPDGFDWDGTRCKEKNSKSVPLTSCCW